MERKDLLFIGKVDRLSGSDNAIVKKEDLELLGTRRIPDSEVNLGKLPNQVVGQAVVFVYDGGIYGICLTKRWITDDYLTKMQKKTGISTDNIEVPVGPDSHDIIEELDEGELITASSVLHDESIVYEGNEIENVVTVQSVTSDEANRYFIAVIEGPLVPMSGTPVTVTGMEGDFVTVESCFTAHEDAHPSVDDEIMVRVVEQLQTESMGVTEAGIPVFISTGQYQVGKELRVTVTEKTESHFIGEVVLDVDRESIEVNELDSVAVENRRRNKRVFWNGIPIDVQSVQLDDLEPKGLVVTGKNSEAVEAKWDLRSAVEDDLSAQVGDEITFKIREAKGDSCIGSYHGYPIVCSGIHAFPKVCEGERIRGVIENIETDKATVSLPPLPETKNEWVVEILGIHRQNGIAVAIGYLVKLSDVRFVSVGDEVSVVVTNRRSDITEVSAGECIDVRVGDEITCKITEANGDSCIGSYQDFPVVCTDIGAFPNECEGRRIKARVQEHKSDRLVISLAHPPESHKELDVEVLGWYRGDAIAVTEGFLVKIPAAEIDARDDVFRVAVTSRGDPITEVSVAARGIFQNGNEELLVRLPETAGDYTIIDGELPVVTSHLPDIDSPVTLGVANVNTDSVVPTVTALPEAHIPNIGDHIETKIIEVDDAFATSVGEEIPIESPLLATVESETIEVDVGNVARNRVSGIAVGMGEGEVNQFHEYYVCLQIAELAYRKQEYEKVREMLVSAREQIPSGEVVLDAILTAHIPLIDILCATDITEVQSSEIEKERERLVELREEIEETEVGSDVLAYLQACDLELKAAQNFIEAVNEATQDTRTSLQSIARGYDSKDRVMEGMTHVERGIKTTAETGFSMFVPSNELRIFVEELRQSYPIPVDELDQIPKPQADANWLSYFVSEEHPEIIKERLSNTDDEVEAWTRPSIPTEFGVWAAESNEQTTSDTMTAKSEYNNDSSTLKTEIESTGDTPSEKQSSGADAATEGESGREANQPNGPDSDTLHQTEEGQAWASDEDDSEEGLRTEEKLGAGIDTTNVEERRVTASPVPDIEVTEELREFRQEAEEDAKENPVVERSETTNTRPGTKYIRSPKIRRYARARANGTCEFCGDSAPFLKPDGDPYLEVHHVDELGEGGADDPSLVVALCPTCHMEIHYGRQGPEINEALREKLEAGLGDVGAVE
jgi:hypothetical protein